MASPVAAILNKVRGGETEDKGPAPVPVPPDIQKRMVRGKERQRRGSALRNLCIRFWRGEQYWYLDNGSLQFLPTTTTANGGGKPRHRVRQVRNLIAPIVEEKVSRSTKRVPAYDIAPTSFDPGRVAAASLAKKVALSGYDQWRIRRATKKVVTLAVVAGEGFAWPFYDTTVGPFAPDPDNPGEWVGRGDVRIRTFSRNQVAWEPGMEFEDSPWIVIQEGRPRDEVMAMDDYMGGVLTPDAQSADSPSLKNRHGKDLVLVTDYLERPNSKYPLGRWLTIANNRIIVGVTLGEGGVVFRPYPLTDSQGNPVDEPVLCHLSYTVDPDSDEDMGLVPHLLDPQRTYNDANNKVLEWKNRVLNPRILAVEGQMITPPDDQPGGIDYYRAMGGFQPPQWQPTPPIPDSLFTVMAQAKADMQQIAATGDVPDDLTAGPAIEATIERSHEVFSQFILDLAKFHERLMRHCLYLVARYYDTPRLMQIRGLIGWEPISAFKGADLLGECDVRVLPGSLIPLTQEQLESRMLNYAQLGWITPEQAMAAIDGGSAEMTVESYELQVARVWRLVQSLKAGPDAFLSTPENPDGTPSWMPRQFDNVRVQKAVFSDWLMTDDFESQSAPVQEAANLIYQGYLAWEAQQAQQAAEIAQQQAQGYGMQNASKPQMAPQMPSLPGPSASPVGKPH